MNQPDLGHKVAELRQQKGLTQEQLAEKCEVNPRTIQRIESYNQALTLFQAVGARLGEANVLYSRGRMLVLTDNSKDGLDELQNALDIYGEIGLISSQANIYFFLGQILASSGQKEDALKMLQEAVTLGEKINPNHPVSIYMKDFMQKIADSDNSSREE